MNKKMIILIILFSLIIIAIITYSLIKNTNQEKYSRELTRLMRKRKTYDELLEIYYSSSGDMNGNVDSLTLDIREKKIKTRFAIYHSDPIEVKEYTVEEKDIKKILQRIEKYNYPMWTSLKDGDEIAYDAPTTGITFSYNNKQIYGSSYETYYIGYNKKMEKDTREELNNFVKELRSLLKDENLIKEYQVK